jgi:hypothetical protein
MPQGKKRSLHINRDLRETEYERGERIDLARDRTQ